MKKYKRTILLSIGPGGALDGCSLVDALSGKQIDTVVRMKFEDLVPETGEWFATMYHRAGPSEFVRVVTKR